MVIVEVVVPFAKILLIDAVMVEVVVLPATGTEPQIESEGVLAQSNVEIKELAETPSPILPFVL
jgi:hypothetical protein